MLSKATKIEEIFIVNLTLSSKCQIDGEDLVNFCSLLRKDKLYYSGNALQCVQGVHQLVDLWKITLCTRGL